jgi:O-antigen/teichoic acid export membrane protein
MILAPKVLTNVIWNWAGFGAETVAGFLIAPFLVHQLGDTVYGIWIIIASLTGYFTFLDLGVRGSVGRQIAFHHSQHNLAAVNKSLSTALAMMGAAAFLGLIATLGIQLFFFDLFDVPPELVSSIRLALLLVGVNLSVMLIMNVFDATLWAFQRFDILNAIDISNTIIRIGLTFFLIGRGYGLVGLALITFSSSILSALLKAGCSFWICPGLRVALSNVSLVSAKGLFSYSIWLFSLSINQVIVRRLSPVIIGALLSVALVTPYSIVTRLIGYAVSLFGVSAGVLIPYSAGLTAQRHAREQRTLHLQSGLYSFLFALCCCALLLCLGQSFIALWMGPSITIPYELLLVLVCGELFPLSQNVSNSIILGMARHRPVAIASYVESGLALVVAATLGRSYGLVGIGAAFAGSALLCRGLFVVLYSCRLVGTPVAEYVRRAFLPPLVLGLGPIAGLVALTQWRAPANWLELVLYALGFCSLYCGSCYVGLRKGAIRNAAARIIRRKEEGAIAVIETVSVN